MACTSPQRFFFHTGESFETTKLPWVSQITYIAQLLNITLKIEISEDIMLCDEKRKEPQTNEYI